MSFELFTLLSLPGSSTEALENPGGGSRPRPPGSSKTSVELEKGKRLKYPKLPSIPILYVNDPAAQGRVRCHVCAWYCICVW